MDFQEIKAKSILTRCGIPGIDYVINPYIGCRFGFAGTTSILTKSDLVCFSTVRRIKKA